MFFRKKKDIDIPGLVQQSGLKHIAFIMDGNGRWATKRGLPREAGHSAGVKNFKTLVRYCKKIGIMYITVYAFSTENWKRPKHEVDAIMNLLDQYMDEAREEPDVEYRFIGDMSRIPPEMAAKVDELEKFTKGFRFRLNIGLNYGGRSEIIHAVNAAIKEGVNEFDENTIGDHLYTAGCPDPDLVVRTGGEYRISNFLLWQSAYSEYCFSEKLWPALTTDDIDSFIIDFAGRHRRFGDVK